MDAHANLLRDLADDLRRRAIAARAEAQTHSDDAFKQGIAHAYYEAVSLVQQQADAFGVSLVDVALEGFDADRELL